MVFIKITQSAFTFAMTYMDCVYKIKIAEVGQEKGYADKEDLVYSCEKSECCLCVCFHHIAKWSCRCCFPLCLALVPVGLCFAIAQEKFDIFE
jgi:hypothetical protein